MGGRTNKPYARPSKANPDAPGSWKHDLHQSPSLADRLSGPGSSRGSSSARPSLLSRISGGQGKELFPQGGTKAGGDKGKELFGFGSTPPVNQSNINAGVELLGPSSKTQNSQGVVRTPRGFQAQDGNRSLAQSGFNAALGQAFGREKREQRRVQERQVKEVSILGAGKQTIVVRVANLAQGTTAEDVVSAFAPIQFLNATASPSSNLVSVDLELTSLKDANELIDKYNGQIADGNKLSVTIIKQQQSQGLASRMGAPVPQQQQEKGRELIVPSSGKMYSDTILRSDPHARIQTVAEAEAKAQEERNRQRADVWRKTGGGFERNGGNRNGGGGGGGRNGGGSLASRLSGGGARGRGGSGMMID